MRSTAFGAALVLALAACVSLAGGAVYAEPFAGIHVSALTGLPDLFSLSVSLMALRPLEVEAGVCAFLPGYYIRAGWGATVADVEHAGNTRRTVHFAGLAGYRYMETWDSERMRGGSLSAQLQFVRWRRLTVGRELQVTMGGMLFDNGVFYPDFRFAFGILF